ncbi:MAG: BcrAD BadFG protein [Pseudomonadota bacterium]|nr:BcrAD BadFG protein [Pseudomonadota bacterium]
MSTAWNFAALPPHIHYAVGVDGGGSNTRARVVHRSGQVVGEGKAGASGLMQGIPQAWRNIAQAIAQAVQGRLQADWPLPTPANSALGLGLAGANNADWNAACLAANPGYTQLVLESDAVTALLGAHQGAPGALVIMGTGAIGLALHANGARTTVGGWGFPCGDEGSGADLGLQAVKRTQHAVDARQAHTALTRDVYATLGNTPQALLTWCGAARQFEYASLAPKVFAHAPHDVEAAQLLAHAAHSLASLALALDPTHTLPLAVAGSIAQRLLPQLSPAIAQRVVVPQGDAMDGALRLCFK